jgi:hypothetical protein
MRLPHSAAPTLRAFKDNWSACAGFVRAADRKTGALTQKATALLPHGVAYVWTELSGRLLLTAMSLRHFICLEDNKKSRERVIVAAAWCDILA